MSACYLHKGSIVVDLGWLCPASVSAIGLEFGVEPLSSAIVVQIWSVRARGKGVCVIGKVSDSSFLSSVGTFFDV